MAVIKAQASGNWSAVGTWSGGVVPTLNDTVYANSFTVALDQSIDLTGSTVDTSGSFIPGQIYMVVSLGTTNFALTANCIAPGTNAGTPVAITSAVGQIFQAVNAGTATTGTARRMGALLNYVNTPLTIATGGGFTLAANWNITGAYIQAGSANCLTVSAAASSTLAGCRATGSAVNLSTRAIAFSSSGTLTLDGIVAIGGRVPGTTAANGAHAIESTSAAGTIGVTNASTLTGGNNSFAYGLNNASTGTIVSTGDITATNSASGLSSDNTAANVKISGSLIGSANGISAIYASKYLIDPTPTTAKFRQGKNGSTTYSDFFTADNSFGQAAITDVRFGTVYASGALTGVAYIPAAGSVALGVPVDATTGTATLTAADVRAAIGLATANLDTQLAAIPTAAGNASAVRTELAPELVQVTEIHAIHGLDIANALTVTPTLRSAGAITQAITGDGTTSTIVTRV